MSLFRECHSRRGCGGWLFRVVMALLVWLSSHKIHFVGSSESKDPGTCHSENLDDQPQQQQQQSHQEARENSQDTTKNDILLLSRIHKDEFYINGTWVKPHSKNTWNVIDPSTDQIFATITVGDEEDTNAAVLAASQAFPRWSLHTTVQQRKSYIQRLFEIYSTQEEEMAFLISREMGAPIDFAIDNQVPSAIFHMTESLELIDQFHFVRTLPNIDPRTTPREDIGTTILMDPVGVVAAITPWNWPMNQIAAKIIPALLVGCTVVWKPSENTPLSALLLADMIHRAQLPPGVFNLVNGQGPVVGAQLSSHPLVNMVSFTGSTRVGTLILKAAADTFKKVALELGGKGAMIVFDDADQDALLNIGFSNSGQSCSFPSRVLVHRSLYNFAVDAAKQAAIETLVDSAHLFGDHIGPVANRIQYDKIQAYIQTGVKEGAVLIAGGLGKPDHLRNSPGFFVKPTVFANCTPSMKIFQEEVFGPFVCLTPFDTEEEAIELANGTPYGLLNYVYTNNGPRRKRLARALKSGMVQMNDEEHDVGAPFGGVGASGIGREGGIYGFEEFCHVKAVTGYYDEEQDDLEW